MNGLFIVSSSGVWRGLGKGGLKPVTRVESEFGLSERDP